MSYDEVIEPRELRNALLAALRLGSQRRSDRPEPARHHGIRP
jgi:acetyl-CoA carboxylase carboxyltransferase component